VRWRESGWTGLDSADPETRCGDADAVDPFGNSTEMA